MGGEDFLNLFLLLKVVFKANNGYICVAVKENVWMNEIQKDRSRRSGTPVHSESLMSYGILTTIQCRPMASHYPIKHRGLECCTDSAGVISVMPQCNHG